MSQQDDEQKRDKSIDADKLKEWTDTIGINGLYKAFIACEWDQLCVVYILHVLFCFMEFTLPPVFQISIGVLN